MIPLKPPVPKKNWKKGIKEIHFPIFDDDQKLINENSYHGIFNGKVVVIKDPNEKTSLSSLVSNLLVNYNLLFNNLCEPFVLGIRVLMGSWVCLMRRHLLITKLFKTKCSNKKKIGKQ